MSAFRRRILGLACAVLAAPAATADQQRDPELRSVIEAAIAGKPCFDDKYDDVVWYTQMQPRVEGRLRQQPVDLRLGQDRSAAARRILEAVHCESNKHAMLRDRPQLVLAVIDVESAFDPFAVSYAGAIGLMQVMPFWPRQLGMSNEQLIRVADNVRMGTTILGYYLRKERGNYQRALQSYNGSLGRPDYSDLVIDRLVARWRYEL